jgi:hypothetical protein
VKRKKGSVFRTLALLPLAVACHDTVGPVARSIPLPTHARMTVGPPPPRTYLVYSSPGGGVALSQYSYDTWVTLVPSGSIDLIALGTIPGASPYYVTGGGIGVNGKIDQHPDAPCVLNISLSDGYGPLSSWGVCGGPVKIDTVLFRKLQAPVAKRGPLPIKHYYDCSNTSDVCHFVNLQQYSTIVEQPIPVTLNKLAANKRTSTFVTAPAVTFTASRTPSTVTVGGGVHSHPLAVTLWQWIGADSTRLPVTGYCLFPTANPLCEFSPRESGRMLLKAFMGGWEQTSSVTVQCLINGEPVFNDSTNDFSVREELLNVLMTSNADSLPEAGWTADHQRGSRHESGGVIWELPNAGGFMFVPYEDPNSNQATYHRPDSLWSPSAAPVPGALPYATVHDHPNTPGDVIYGAGGTTVLPDGTIVPFAQYPGDTVPQGWMKPVTHKVPDDTLRAGSGADWRNVIRVGLPDYIVGTVGFVHRLDPPPPNLDPLSVPTRYSGGSAAQRKCSWVKKYRG